jgi:hypothetical protein
MIKRAFGLDSLRGAWNKPGTVKDRDGDATSQTLFQQTFAN